MGRLNLEQRIKARGESRWHEGKKTRVDEVACLLALLPDHPP